MAVTLSDLIAVPTKEQILDKFVAILRLAGFPTASWQSGAFMRHTVETESELFVDISTLIQNVAKGGFIKLAGDIDDSWADLCAENVFGEVRKPAVFTQGKAIVTDAAGVGPVAISAGSFWIANTDKSLRYVNTTGGTLPLNGTLELDFQAESAGTIFNVGAGSLREILTPQPGVTVDNVAQDSGTWITQQGADVESSAALAQRCLDKWSTLGSGSDEGAYRYVASSSSNEITRVRVYSPGAGAIRVVVAGDAGPVSSAALASAAAAVEAKRPLGVPDVATSNAEVYSQPIVGILTVTAGRDKAAVLAAAQASLNEFQRALMIGSKVSREKVVRALLVDGVDDLELTTPAADYQLSDLQIWIPSYQLVTA